MTITKAIRQIAAEISEGKPITKARRAVLKPLLEDTYEWMTKHNLKPSYLSNCTKAIVHVALTRSIPPSKWKRADWESALLHKTMRSPRQWLAALAFNKYKINLASHFHDTKVRNHNSCQLAVKFFGRTRTHSVCDKILSTLKDIGYKLNKHNQEGLRGNICEILTISGECSIKALTVDRIMNLRRHGKAHKRVKHGHAITVALHQLGLIDEPVWITPVGGPASRTYRAADGVPKEWHDWVERWRRTSCKEDTTLRSRYSALMTAGRWIKAKRPEASSPARWTGEIAAEYVRAVHDLTVGQYMSRIPMNVRPHVGRPMKPKSKEFRLSVLRCFFRDLEDWGWVKLSFNADRVIRSSFLVRKQIKPDPKPIDNHAWAKLIWAGINFTHNDFYTSPDLVTNKYPFSYVKAVALTWLFSGLRQSEIRRLRVGCVRRDPQTTSVNLIEQTIESTPKICYLSVPLGKRRASFEKPVDAIIADAIEAWERDRPHQLPRTDPKTKESVDYLWTFRGKMLGEDFINGVLIDRLCNVAGIPRSDSKGKITSHRARHTMATLLANGKAPMTLYQLAEWLGHDSIESSLQYVDTPLTELTSAFKKVDYFRTNIRTIEVLLDRSAIKAGTNHSETPYKYYNLGPVGYCANEFWAKCEHRMACIKCPFHRPRDDSRIALLEAKGDLSRMLEEVALTDEEQRELSDDIDHVDTVLQEWHANMSDSKADGSARITVPS